jgi:TolA-binding protein
MKPIFGALRRSAHTEARVLELAREQSERFRKHDVRLGKQRQRLDTLRAEIRGLRGELRRQAQLITEQKKAIAQLKQDIRRDLQPLKRNDSLREVDFGRAMHQVGALEARVGRLEAESDTDRLAADDESLAEARSLVDTVRREHDHARVRLQVMSSYEERVRRLEAAMLEIYDGDLRQTL